MANELTTRRDGGDDDQPMAIMPGGGQPSARDLVGYIRVLKPTACFVRAQVASYLKTLHDRKLWKDAGYRTFEACAQDLIGNKKTAYDLIEELAAFGPTMMRLLDQAHLNRRVRRVLSHSDQKDLLQLKKFLDQEKPDPEEIHDAAMDIFNRLVAAEGEARAAREKADRVEEDLKARKQALKEEHEKRTQVQAELDRLRRSRTKDPEYSTLFVSATRALAELADYVLRTGIVQEDAERFRRDVQILRSHQDTLWRNFIDPPEGMESKAKYIKWLMEERGLSKREAEEVADETEL